ncbi:MAG: hypothetical protein JSS11_12035 [Verrucomicrobia bacterium]|nr:hypothetical protein [Verrucomicrobiota bacterium]
MRVVGVVAGFFTALRPARAAFPLAVDDAAVCAPGQAEIVSAWQYNAAAGTEEQGADGSATLGLGRGWEASLAGGYGWLRTERGPDRRAHDVTLGLKALCFGTETAACSGTLSATGTRSIGPSPAGRRPWGGLWLAAVTHRQGATSFDVNAGLELPPRASVAESPPRRMVLGAAVRRDVSARLMVFAECTRTVEWDRPGRPGSTQVQAGAQLAVAPAWSVGVSLGRSAGGPSATTAALGVTMVR